MTTSNDGDIEDPLEAFFKGSMPIVIGVAVAFIAVIVWLMGAA